MTSQDKTLTLSTLQGQDLDAAIEFEMKIADQGCSCHLNAPCSYCTHPGNPDNLEGKKSK